jgi:hypothetical protein
MDGDEPSVGSKCMTKRRLAADTLGIAIAA